MQDATVKTILKARLAKKHTLKLQYKTNFNMYIYF